MRSDEIARSIQAAGVQAAGKAAYRAHWAGQFLTELLGVAALHAVQPMTEESTDVAKLADKAVKAADALVARLGL